MHFYPNKNFTENTIINNPNYNAKINKNIFLFIHNNNHCSNLIFAPPPKAGRTPYPQRSSPVKKK